MLVCYKAHISLITKYNDVHMQTDATQDWRKRLDEIEENLKAKHQELAQREEDLKIAQQEKDTLIHMMTEIREEIYSAQKRIEALQQEKNNLEKDLKVKEAEMEVLMLKNFSIVTANDQVVDYQKQLESVKLALETEKKIFLLQVKLEQKRVDLAKKSVEIRFLRKERDWAKLQAKIEKEKADMISRQLAAEATSHAVHMKEVQVSFTFNPMTYMSVHLFCI